jgi:NADPH:quinone reductase-like Zn-dependent oxidoreductase
VVEIAKLESGQTVFVNGGSSCIGAMAIQIAKARGVRVVACASGRNEELVRNLGADEVSVLWVIFKGCTDSIQFFDYTKRPLHEQLRDDPPNPKFHAFIECVGIIDPSLYLYSPAYLAPGAPFITSGPLPSGLALNDILLTLKQAFEALIRPTWLGGVNRPYK